MSEIKKAYSEDFTNNEFIEIINSFNASIEEYFEVSKYNLKESNNFLNILEKGIKNIEDSINDINNKKSFDIKSIFQNLDQTKSIINQLIKISDSNDNNLDIFYKNSKLLFKKMKFENNNSRNKNNITFSAKNILNRKERNCKYMNLNYESYKNYNLNINKNNNFDYNKLIYYLKKMEDYNEIIGKISIKDKNNYINLHKMLINALGINEYFKYYKIEDEDSYQQFATEKDFNLDKVKQKFEYDKFQEKQKNENIINSFSNKEKKLENNRKLSMKNMRDSKFLKDKIIIELININKDYSQIDNSGNFEEFIINIIKNLSHEINQKNKIIKKLEINNNALIHNISDKINNIKDKENEILNIKKENENIRLKYEEVNQLNMKNQIKLLNYEKKSMQGELNKIKLLNININNNQINNIDSMVNAEKDNEIKKLKKELEIQKNYLLISKNNHSNEINLFNTKIQNLSRQITLKNQEIIFLQKQILENKNNNDDQLKKLNIIHEKEIENKNKEIISLKNKSNEQDKDNNLIELNKIISDYKNQIELKNKEISDLKTNLKNNNENEKNNKSELIMEYKEEINQLNSVIMKGNIIIQEKDRIIKELKENIENKEDSNFNENKNCYNASVLTNKSKIQENMIKDLEDNDSNSIEIIVVNNIKQELDIIKKEKMGLENKINLLNHEIENLNSINEKLMSENKLNLNNEILHKKEDELGSLKSFNLKLQTELEKTKKDNELLKLQFNSLEKKLDEVNKENKSLKSNLELNKQISGKF